MTKFQLKQWLTKHDQRLPPNERLKPFYLERAIDYLHTLEREEYGQKMVSNTRRKKKKKSGNASLTPKSRTKKEAVVRTQRRHSAIGSPSPSLNRSKKRSIKVPRKTPTKHSPSLQRSIKKKRERVRRATADPVHLQQLNDNDSENSGDHHNIEKMTIRNLQEWLDANHIDFVNGQRKAVYVNLVKKHSENINTKKRNLSPKHKKHNSPKYKKPKAYHHRTSSPIANAPLPPNIRQSPLTPQEDEKTRSRINKQHALLTPVLNKTGVARINTPSKAAMRDEIRCLLDLDDDEGPLYPAAATATKDHDDDGITPGGTQPHEYDASELENVLTDLRRQNEPKQVDKQRVKVYDPDEDQKEKDMSMINSIMAKFSPHKAISPKSMKNQANDVLTTNKKHRKVSYVAKRTVPSPASPQVFEGADVNGNFSNQKQQHIVSPINDYQQKLLNRYDDDDEPMSPAMNRKTSDEVVIPSIPAAAAAAQVNKTAKKKEKQPIKGRCKAVTKILFLAVFGAAIGCLFAVFDGMAVMKQMKQYIIRGGEQQMLFCDSDTRSIGGSSRECVRCPLNALVCMNGRVECKTNYMLRNGKCVVNRVTVQYAYDLNKQIGAILSSRKGRYECGDDGGEGYTMNEDELIALCDVFDESKKEEAFEYFRHNILKESSVVSVNAAGKYFSYKSIKSPSCRLQEWAIANLLGLVATFIIASMVFAIWYQYRKRQWEKKAVDAMMTNIYNILDECEKFNKQRHVPIDVIKQRCKPKTKQLWQKVDALIQTDANITKSIRMIDGLQKRCLALSSVANCMATAQTFPPHSKRSMW